MFFYKAALGLLNSNPTIIVNELPRVLLLVTSIFGDVAIIAITGACIVAIVKMLIN